MNEVLTKVSILNQRMLSQALRRLLLPENRTGSLHEIVMEFECVAVGSSLDVGYLLDAFSDGGWEVLTLISKLMKLTVDAMLSLLLLVIEVFALAGFIAGIVAIVFRLLENILLFGLFLFCFICGDHPRATLIIFLVFMCCAQRTA